MFYEPPRWDVELSSLDYVQFLSSPPPRAPDERPMVIKIELSGTGYLTLQAGRSERVNDAFWRERSGSTWDDLRRDQLVLSRERTEVLFQRLVDMGFFERKFPEVKEGDEAARALVVLGSINKRRKIRITDDPRVWSLFDELLREF